MVVKCKLANFFLVADNSFLYYGYCSEHCNEEETVEVFGRIKWSNTPVNKTEVVPCPFGSKGDYIRRRCHWDGHVGAATWQSLAGDETCRKQVQSTK